MASCRERDSKGNPICPDKEDPLVLKLRTLHLTETQDCDSNYDDNLHGEGQQQSHNRLNCQQR